MNSCKAKVVVNPDGSWAMVDSDGINIGSQFSNTLNEVVTFINCRKDGVPVGRDYGWYANGNKYFVNTWASDGSGKLLKWQTWSRHGEKLDGCSENVCSLCDGALKTAPSATIFNNCAHKFHFSCMQDWLQMHDTCPNCDEMLENTITMDDRFSLCRVVAKNIFDKSACVSDIFGNTVWIKTDFVHLLPGHAGAAHENAPTIIADRVFIDKSCNIVLFCNTVGQFVYVGNVKTIKNIANFKFELKNYLIDNRLIADDRLVFLWK